MTQRKRNMKRAEKSAPTYFVTMIDDKCRDLLIEEFSSEYAAYVYLVSRYPYMKRITTETVCYQSQYGSNRSVYVTSIGSNEYFCIWKGD